MSITVEISNKQLDTSEKLNLHYLPAQVDGDGEVNVDKFFNNYTKTENGYLTNALRGYPLVGEEINIPENYKAVVLQETQKPLDESADRTVRMTGTFNKFTYWNYDRIPSKGDAYKQALQFVTVSHELAQPIKESDVLKEIEAHKEKWQSNNNE